MNWLNLSNKPMLFCSNFFNGLPNLRKPLLNSTEYFINSLLNNRLFFFPNKLNGVRSKARFGVFYYLFRNHSIHPFANKQMSPDASRRLFATLCCFNKNIMNPDIFETKGRRVLSATQWRFTMSQFIAGYIERRRVRMSNTDSRSRAQIQGQAREFRIGDLRNTDKRAYPEIPGHVWAKPSGLYSTPLPFISKNN